MRYKVSKKDRKEQRAAFRQLAEWIIRGDRPHERYLRSRVFSLLYSLLLLYSVRLGGACVEASSFARWSSVLVLFSKTYNITESMLSF